MGLEQSILETLEWIGSGVVAALVIRASEFTDNWVVLGIAFVIAVIIGTVLNYAIQLSTAEST